jgi:hypothetical protein
MSHLFEVGKTYRNRVGEYVVQAIDGDQMTIRYVSGGTLATNVAVQTRIWENIQFEEQMVREEERQRLAREERLAARKRAARAKAEKAKPQFNGFQENDFASKKRGIAWSSRQEMGKFLAYELGQRTEGAFGQWIVPRQSKVHVARQEFYDRDARDRVAALFVAVDDQGVTYGFRAGKPDGKVKAQWPWSALLAALADDQKVRRALRSVMKAHEVSLDVYAMEVSYGQVGQITIQDRGFLWQHETAEQAMTRRMNWEQLVDYLQTAASDKRCDLYLRKRLPAGAALKSGAAVSGEILAVFEALLPVYDATAGA